MSIEAIKPDLGWTVQDVTKATEDTLNETVTAIYHDFRKTTRTWITKVDWVLITAYASGKNLQAATGTNSKIYMYVTRGTKPHVIRPKRGRVLSYLSGYRAKTGIRRIGSNAGGAYGTRVFAKEVHHPGTQAREFEETLVDKYQPILKNRMQASLNKVMKVNNAL